MKMRLIDDERGAGPYLQIIDTTEQEYKLIIGWGEMRWIHSKKWLEGYASLELLNKVYGLLNDDGKRLPPSIERRRVELQRTRDALNRERANEQPTPFYAYPVKMKLYAHQVRGANMALLNFGWIQPGTDA